MLGDFFGMDRNRQYFIFTGGYMEKVRPYTHILWRQDDPELDTEPNMVELTITQPITTEVYYTICDQIDRQNRCRQESLDIEKSSVLKIGQISSTYLFLR